MKNDSKFIILLVLNIFFIQTVSAQSLQTLNTTLTPLEDVKGLGKVTCDLRVPPSLVNSFKLLLNGGTTQSDGGVTFRLQPPSDTITLNDKKDENGNVISNEKTIAFRTRDFDVNNPGFFVDSVASYDITRSGLRDTLLGKLASGDVNFKFLASRTDEDTSKTYKLTNVDDQSFAIARITSVQPLTYINTDGTKVKTAALSGRLKVTTNVNFLGRSIETKKQTILNTGEITLDCRLVKCVLDRLKNIDLINTALNNCSNILFSGGSVVATTTANGIVVPECICGTGQTLSFEGSAEGEVTCCDPASVSIIPNNAGTNVPVCNLE